MTAQDERDLYEQIENLYVVEPDQLALGIVILRSPFHRLPHKTRIMQAIERTETDTE